MSAASQYLSVIPTHPPFISDDMIITLCTALKSQYESKFPDKNDLPSDINELRDKLIPNFLNQKSRRLRKCHLVYKQHQKGSLFYPI